MASQTAGVLERQHAPRKPKTIHGFVTEENWDGGVNWVGDLGDLGFRCVKMSRDEWLQLPPKPKSEWSRGMAIMMAPQANRHSFAQSQIYFIIRRDLPNTHAAVEYWIRFPDNDRVPDVAVMRKPSATGKYDEQIPELVVEVLSPSTWRNDLNEKADDYAAAGIPQYWLVDYETQSIIVKQNDNGAWRTKVILNAENPQADLPVSDLGVVHLNIAEVFG